MDARDASGRRIRRLFQTPEAAAAFERRLDHEKHAAREERRAAAVARGEIKLESIEAAIDYVNSMRTGLNNRNTAKAFRCRILDLDRAISLPLDQISRRDVDRYFADLRGRLAPSSVATAASNCRVFFEILAAHQIIPSSPARHLTFRRPPPDESRSLIVSYEHEYEMLESAGDKMRIRIYLALDGGLSAAESCSLKVRDADLTRRALHVPAGVNRHASRTFPLTDRLAAELSRFTAGASPDAFILTSPTGRGSLTPGGASLTFRDFRGRLGLYFKLHDLRHTFASRLSSASSNAFLVSYVLGHRRPYTTPLQAAAAPTTPLYVHQDWREMRAAFDRMESTTEAELNRVRSELCQMELPIVPAK